jgi:hypothetical protein
MDSALDGAAAPVPDGTAQSHRTAGIQDRWYWPEPLQSERCCVLSLKARVLNYAAHLTDFTCDVPQCKNFSKLSHGAIHSQRHRPWTPVLLCPILWATWATRTSLVRCQSVFFYCLVHALLPRPVERAQWPTGTLSVRSNPLSDSVLHLRAFLADLTWSLVCLLFILGSLSLSVVRNLLRRMAFEQEHSKMRARADHGTKTQSTGDLCFSICCLLT